MFRSRLCMAVKLIARLKFKRGPSTRPNLTCTFKVKLTIRNMMCERLQYMQQITTAATATMTTATTTKTNIRRDATSPSAHKCTHFYVRPTIVERYIVDACHSHNIDDSRPRSRCMEYRVTVSFDVRHQRIKRK